jgi:hypothetical protein
MSGTVPSIPNTDQAGFVGRLLRRLPTGWFPDTTPILTGVLSGIASMWASQWQLLEFVVEQMRISTATDVWLDMAAANFLGLAFLRKPNETDAKYRARIVAEIIRPRATREAVIEAITNLTGLTPVMIEPFNLSDVGSYGNPKFAYGQGRWGSLTTPFQAFVLIYRPLSTGIPSVMGYGWGGYGNTPFAYMDVADFIGPGDVTDAEVFAMTASTQAAGVTVWTAITTPPVSTQGDLLDINFILDVSYMA